MSKSIQSQNPDVSTAERFTWKFFEYLKDCEQSSSQTAVSEYAQLHSVKTVLQAKCHFSIKFKMGPYS